MEPIILSLGSINADFQVRVDEPPGASETALAHDLLRLGGGKAANVAFLARRLGHGALLLGRVGDDDLAEQALAPLREAGIDVSGVSRAPGCQTGLAMIFVPPSGKKNIVLATNANDAWGDGEIEALCRRIEAAPEGSVLAADCEVPARAVREAASVARRRGLRVVLDPSFPDRVDGDLLAAVDAITPNESEARQLPGAGNRRDPEELARALAAQGPETVCIKLEDGGCLVLADGKASRIPSRPVEVVDSTGAGDAFTGAFAVAWLEGRSALEAARFAAAASSAAVTGYGSQPAYPDREAIAALLKNRGNGSGA